ncbi:hypothetical protein DSO57_1039080 [Entomophthora muscae]|uniref:Uncharacterized protein n=2 Tax=Entomophthora muscae TaxID=34485 RepID=A0ACC2UIF7_9FUNG|nr:hypothetical protein DSO57_1019073 [Entomophthora muscae]KAJ9086874.1 hypothetical protein DSO57_1039080 [Entomophthora muscae]
MDTFLEILYSSIIRVHISTNLIPEVQPSSSITPGHAKISSGNHIYTAPCQENPLQDATEMNFISMKKLNAATAQRESRNFQHPSSIFEPKEHIMPIHTKTVILQVK